jgi:hypothetical protein
MALLSSKRARLPFVAGAVAVGAVACAPYAGTNTSALDTQPAGNTDEGSASSSTVYGTSAGDDGGDRDASPTTNTDADVESGVEASADACWPMATDACRTCCHDAHPSGAKVKDDAYYGCICGTCQWQCALSLCSVLHNAPGPGGTCDTCVSNVGTCEPAVQSACTSNAECVAFDACTSGCH